MVEFTGERLVPGRVESDLYNEHVSRYHFCAPLVRGKRCLDAGCGLGYGSAILAKSAASVVGIDNDELTIQEATQLYGRDNLHFAVADVQNLPWGSREFDCAVSFEVIEHLSDPAALVDALKRITRPEGIVILSTPNREAYNVSRGEAGPNPFHQHEFTLSEFEDLLRARFRYIRILAQNHSPSITFRQQQASKQFSAFSLADQPTFALDTAQFFLAICSQEPLPEIADAVYVADDGNVLFEREAHIQLLNSELSLKTSWLEKAQKDLADLHTAHQALKDEHDRRSAWALTTIQEMEATNRKLAEQLDAKCAELQVAVDRLNAAEATIVDRSEWAKRLDTELSELRTKHEQLSKEQQLALDRCNELSVTLEAMQGPHRELLINYARVRSDYAADLQALAHAAGLNNPAAKKRDALPTMRDEHDLEAAKRLYDELEKTVALYRLRSKQLQLAMQSRWLKLGRWLGLGPRIDDSQREL